MGIVELAVGVQKYIADYDDIIFDIGHQRYVFEMLYNMKEKGMFINRTENKYDFFHHPAFAGLSVASALGKALASNKTRKQVRIKFKLKRADIADLIIFDEIRIIRSRWKKCVADRNKRYELVISMFERINRRLQNSFRAKGKSDFHFIVHE